MFMWLSPFYWECVWRDGGCVRRVWRREIVRGVRVEAAAVLGGADVGACAGTRGACVSAVPKPHSAAIAASGSAGVLEPRARGLQAHALDVAGGRHAGLGAEGAREVARAHVRARGHRLDGVLAGDVLEHGALDLAQRLALGAAARRAWR